MSNLVIVESAGKTSKISQFLGKSYVVKASMGHFRDLDPKKMSINLDKNFEPEYIITKADVVRNLKSASKNAKMVYIASDLDMEGEAIAQSLCDVLKPTNYKRIRFNQVTKSAILEAIKNAGTVNKNIVSAQKARRVLDRLYGYTISPLLGKCLGGNLSAGRVQSVATEIIVDKENEIVNFIKKNTSSSLFRVKGIFSKMKSILHESTDKKPDSVESAYKSKIASIPLVDSDNPTSKVTTFLKKCLKSTFKVHSIAEKMTTRSPSPPFTTSTLQQESNRKLGMSIDLTMKNAQKLYEGGFITYMRTDSVEISDEAHKDIKKVILEMYGKDFYQKNIYKNKNSSAQEAHEAIRPTHADLCDISKELDDEYQIKLYKLIWKRTIASQMKSAQIKITTVQISISKYIDEKINPFYFFQSQVDTIVFYGFMKVYVESTDDTNDTDDTDDTDDTNPKQNSLKNIPKIDSQVYMKEIIAKQEYGKPPVRYTQASLVKKLEELGIGRPSTYVNTIKTIMDRFYVKIGDCAGIKKDVIIYKIMSEKSDKKSGKESENSHVMEIFEENTSIQLGKELKKLMPTDLGIKVNTFLLHNFSELMDYKFTAKMEKELDDISAGTKVWHKVVKKFYDKLSLIVTSLNDSAITLNAEKFEKNIGQYKGKDVLLKKSRYGFYLLHNKEIYSLPSESSESSENLKLSDAIIAIKNKTKNNLGVFNVMYNNKKVQANVFIGKFGPYCQIQLSNKKINFPIPKTVNTKSLTSDILNQIIGPKKIYKKNTVKNGSKTTKK